MASKRFQGKTCAYCAKPDVSDVGEHVLARHFVPKGRARNNLPKVPACDACNTAKHLVEDYAQTVAVLGGRHPAALANAARDIETKARTRPRHVLALRRTVEPALEITPGGIAVRTGTLTVDTSRMIEFYRFLVRGLYFHHTGEPLPPDVIIQTVMLKPDAEAVFIHDTIAAFGPDVLCVGGDLGEGVLRYEARISRAVPGASVWQLEFARMRWVVGNDRPRAMVSRIYFATVPKPLLIVPASGSRSPSTAGDGIRR